MGVCLSVRCAECALLSVQMSAIHSSCVVNGITMRQFAEVPGITPLMPLSRHRCLTTAMLLLESDALESSVR